MSWCFQRVPKYLQNDRVLLLSQKETWIVMHVVDFLPKTEAKDGTNVVGSSIESLYGETFD